MEVFDRNLRILKMMFVVVLVSFAGCNGRFKTYKLSKSSNIVIHDYVGNSPDEMNKKKKLLAVICDVELRYKRLCDVSFEFPIKLGYADLTDACTRRIGGELGVFLNFRILSQYSKTVQEIVVAHEFFHIIQYKELDYSQYPNTIAMRLQVEGFATFASSLLYPGSSDWKYISYYQDTNAEYLQFQKYEKEAIKKLRPVLLSHGQEEHKIFFSGNPEYAEPWPRRIGYYIGFKIAKQWYEDSGSDFKSLFTHPIEVEKLLDVNPS